MYFSCFIILSCVVLNLNTASFDDNNNDDDDHYYCYHHHFISSTIIIILIFTSGNFYFSFVSNSLAYIIIPQNNGKMKINWDKKNLLEHICVYFLLYNLPLILNLNTYLLNFNTASFDDDDDDYCYHHHFINSIIIIIIIIIKTIIIIIFLLRNRVFFNRCSTVCFSGQAVYSFTAIKPSSRSSSSFVYLFFYLSTFIQSFLFLYPFSYTFSCLAFWWSFTAHYLLVAWYLQFVTFNIYELNMFLWKVKVLSLG